MVRAEAFDINGTSIKHGDLVKVVAEDNSSHAWIRVGNTFRVSWWEDRSGFLGADYMCVFLKSKKGGRMLSQGIQDKKLLVIEGS